jgi:hypothetical protein
MMKLTTEQHVEIAKHLYAADHHLLKVCDVLCNRNVTPSVPSSIVDDIEKVRDALGATPSASRNSQTSILGKCENVLASDWPNRTFDTYRGSYGDCVMLLLEDGPYRPPED